MSKLRFFAALPLLYHFVIWLLFSMLSAELGPSDRLIVLTFVFIVILAIHSLVQPYRKPKHNYIETLYLANVVFISMMWLIGQLTTCLSVNTPKLAIPLVFLTIPCMPALWELWVEDFRNCVTQLSDVIGGGRDVSSESTDSLPHLVALNITGQLCFMNYQK